jgi:hypothetical protein
MPGLVLALAFMLSSLVFILPFLSALFLVLPLPIEPASIDEPDVVLMVPLVVPVPVPIEPEVVPVPVPIVPLVVPVPVPIVPLVVPVFVVPDVVPL